MRPYPGGKPVSVSYIQTVEAGKSATGIAGRLEGMKVMVSDNGMASCMSLIIL